MMVIRIEWSGSTIFLAKYFDLYLVVGYVSTTMNKFRKLEGVVKLSLVVE